MGKAITDLANYKPNASGYIPVKLRAALAAQAAAGGKDAKPAKVQTDEQILAKLTDSFNTLSSMTEAVIAGQIHSLVVSGPPGVGKSFITDALLEKARLSKKHHIEDVHGYVRPTGLYKLFFERCKPTDIIKFDDSDSIWKDPVALNILKAALDMKARRRISWLAETKMRTEEGDLLPRSFDFEGNVIFITNLDFAAAVESGSELSEHLAAVMSRSHYLDLAMKTDRDRLMRIKQVVTTERMLEKDGFSTKQSTDILDYIEKHSPHLRELSLRMVAKIADLSRAKPTEWQTLAKRTCMKGEVE